MSDLQTAMQDIAQTQQTIRGELSNQIGGIETRQREFADRLITLEQKGFTFPQSTDQGSFSPLSSFLSGEAFRSVQNGAPSTGRVELKNGGIKLITKALTSDGVSNNYGVQPQRANGLFNDPRRTLGLFDVLPTVRVSSNAYEYIQLSSFIHAATYQGSEGDAKTEQTIDTATATAPIKTIATWTKASRQVLSDVALLEKQLGSLLAYGCLRKLEAEIIAGTGTGDAMTGLIAAGSALTTTGTPANRISSGAMQMLATGWNPGLVLMNNTDWHTIRTLTATGGEYVSGNWSEPSPPSIWGMPVIVSPSVTANTALVIDPSQVAVLDREAPTVMLSNSDADNFTTNLVSMLVELRAGLAIYAPTAIGKITLS